MRAVNIHINRYDIWWCWWCVWRHQFVLKFHGCRHRRRRHHQCHLSQTSDDFVRAICGRGLLFAVIHYAMRNRINIASLLLVLQKLYNVVFIEPIYRQQRVSMFAGKEHTTSHTHIHFPIKHITIRSPFTQRRTFIDKHCCRVLQLTY